MWWKLGCALGALGVALGAFGAHGLRGVVDDPALLDTWETAARYHLFHALALLAVGLHPRPHRAAGWLFTVGVVLFSGSLYALVLTDLRAIFGPITPLGGLCFIAGWAALAASGAPTRAVRDGCETDEP